MTVNVYVVLVATVSGCVTNLPAELQVATQARRITHWIADFIFVSISVAPPERSLLLVCVFQSSGCLTVQHHELSSFIHSQMDTSQVLVPQNQLLKLFSLLSSHYLHFCNLIPLSSKYFKTLTSLSLTSFLSGNKLLRF